MIKRTILVTQPCQVRVKANQLQLHYDDEILGRVPCEDIGILLIENEQVTVTQRALVRCMEENAVVVICDARHMPCALLQPIQANTLHAKELRIQITATKATHDRIWKQIITAKICHQAALLERIQSDARHLFQLSSRVKSGDKENLEAQAARIYWSRLFGNDFRRKRHGGGMNTFLNYGYAVLRAAVARAICAAGLHPALGIHHSNQYNAFALADDLMEPLRPVVDHVVYKLGSEHGVLLDELTPPFKTKLLEIAAANCVVGERQLPLMIALQSYVSSFRAVLARESKQIVVPVP